MKNEKDSSLSLGGITTRLSKISCECGLSYVHGVSEDDAEHAACHTEYEQGPLIPHQLLPPQVGGIEDAALYLIDNSTREHLRKKCAYVAEVAQRETPDFSYGYYGTSGEIGTKLFLLCRGGRSIAHAVVCIDSHFWALRWGSQSGAQLITDGIDATSRVKVARIWVAASHRRQRMAAKLLGAIAKHYAVPIGDMGWEMPLTQRGERLVRRLCPDAFWARGDAFALAELLRTCA